MSVSILLFLLTDAITQIALLAIVALRAYSRHSEFRADHHRLRHVHPEALASAFAALDQKRTGDWREFFPFFNVLFTHPSTSIAHQFDRDTSTKTLDHETVQAVDVETSRRVTLSIAMLSGGPIMPTPDPSESLSYRQFLMLADPPVAMYGINAPNDIPTDVAWAFKFPIAELNTIPRDPAIGFRSLVIQMGHVFLVANLIQFAGSRHPTMFETWMNAYNQDHDGLLAMRLLASQNTIALHLIDEHTIPRRSILLRNDCQHFFRRTVTLVESVAPWTMSEFDRARDAVSHHFPTAADLWKACQSNHPRIKDLS